MKYEPTITKTSVIFDLYKPIYGSYFGIWEKWLNKAGDRWIVINTPMGKATFKSAKAYKKKAKRMERYYKNPDVPMIFWGLEMLPSITDRTERKKAEHKLDSTKVPYDVKLKLAQRIAKKNPRLAKQLNLI